MKNVLIYCCLVLVVVFYNCAGSNQGETQNTNQEHWSNAELVDTIELSIDTNYSYLHNHTVVLDIDTGLLYFAIDSEHNMLIYNLQQNKLLHSYNIPQEGPNFINTDAIVVKNFDSIYSLSRQNVLTLFDVKGNILEKKTIPVPEQLNQSGVNFLNFSTSFCPPFLNKKTNVLYFPGYDAGEKPRKDFPIFFGLDLNKMQYIAMFGQKPEVAFSDPNLYPFLNLPSVTTNDSLTIIQYYMQNYIQIYNNMSGKLIKNVNINSEFVSEVLGCNNCNDIQKKRNYMDTEAKYLSLIYDEYNHLYYIVVKHKIDLKNNDGNLNQFMNCGWSIIFLDENFDKIGEQKFEGNTYNPYRLFPIKGGFLIDTNNPFNKNNDNENIIKLHKYRFQKI